MVAALEHVEHTLPDRVALDPDKVEQGLAKLVLTLIELIRRLLEKQAIRRIEAGSLSDEEIERMGETFLKLEAKMQELKRVFGLEGQELNINLGPLGDLM
ncbi:MAG: gas vesicle protein K [Chloroflexi bacterium]|nr:gas vesicle protein K [Chloroflexota bacterium]